MGASQQIETRARWLINLDAQTTTTTYPTAATAGIAPPSQRMVGARVLVGARLVATGGTPSMTVSVYGYDAVNALWFYLGRLNGGAIGIDTATWSPTSLTVNYVETLTVGSQFDRLITRLEAVAGTGGAVTTRFGFSDPV